VVLDRGRPQAGARDHAVRQTLNFKQRTHEGEDAEAALSPATELDEWIPPNRLFVHKHCAWPAPGPSHRQARQEEFSIANLFFKLTRTCTPLFASLSFDGLPSPKHCTERGGSCFEFCFRIGSHGLLRAPPGGMHGDAKDEPRGVECKFNDRKVLAS